MLSVNICGYNRRVIDMGDYWLNLSDIAKLAGVSKATVSSVLNGKAEKYRISKKTQERVLAIAEQHNYQPNQSAATLRRGRSNSIGLIVPDFENRSYLRIAKRLEALARKVGYQLIITTSDDTPELERDSARMLVARGVDALLVSTSTTDTQLYEDLLAKGMPVIAIDRSLPDQFSNVISDDRQGAIKLTQALPLRQLSSISLISALPDLEVSREREKGFRDALVGMPNVHAKVYYGEHFDPNCGAQLLLQAIEEQGQVPPAILTTSYALLEGVIEVLQSKYPEQLSPQSNIRLATFGDSRTLDFMPVPVVSFPQQYEQIAEAAWNLVVQALDSHYQPQKIVIRRLLKDRAAQRTK